VAEIAGRAGFDWCVIDMEHAPATLPLVQAQLQALAGTPAAPVVRVPVGDEWVLKQVLDLGAQSVIVPMVHDAASAARAVAAVRYPPYGRRGMGAALSRAGGWGATADYVASADAEICLIVQAESAQALHNIDAIATTDGVDVVFIGPADLAADMGHGGETDHPAVVAAVDRIVERTRAAGKAAGIITFDPKLIARYAAKGFAMIGVGADCIALRLGLESLVRVASLSRQQRS
jgi:4-hydroxy-2-oxoheptanedioate aldolase